MEIGVKQLGYPSCEIIFTYSRQPNEQSFEKLFKHSIWQLNAWMGFRECTVGR